MTGANIPIPDCCEEAGRLWKLEALLNDLSKVKRKLRLTNEGLTENEMAILCVLLNDNGPKPIAKELGKTEGAIKTALSTGLYDYIEYLNGSRPRTWIQAIKILSELGYHNTSSNPLPNRLTALLVLTVIEVSESQVKEILEFLRDKTGDSSLMLMRTEKGSVVLVLEGSQEGCDRLLQLFESGELTEILGIPLQDVQVVVASSQAAAPSSPVNLSQWLQGVFQAGWQSVEALLGGPEPEPAWAVRSEGEEDFTDAVKRGRLIDLGIELAGHSIALVAALLPESSKKINIRLRVYPMDGETYLPKGLILTLLDESGEPISDEETGTPWQVRAREADNWIQWPLYGEPGDRFWVKISLGDASVTEEFVI